MCDSNHHPSTSSDSKMPPPDAVIFHKLRELRISSPSSLIHPNGESPNPDKEAPVSLNTATPPEQPNCTSDQFSSSQPSLVGIPNSPNWRDQQKLGTVVNHTHVESACNLEHRSRGNDTENGLSTESTGEFERRPPTSSSKSTEEARQEHCAGKFIAAPSMDGREKLAERLYISESERSHRRQTIPGANGRATVAEGIEDNVADDNKQNFRSHRPEIETETDANETQTRLVVSTRTNSYDSKSRSRLEPCSETNTGFDEFCETETGFRDTGETEIGFDRSKEQLTSSSRSKFDACAIETATHELLQRTLERVTYDPQRCRVLSHDLAGKVLETIISLTPRRYKLVTFVSIGSLTDDPGIQFGSRCLWEADTDQLATVRYANETLFAVVMVYALYRE